MTYSPSGWRKGTSLNHFATGQRPQLQEALLRTLHGQERVWGRNYPVIPMPGADVVKQVVPAAELGHFDGGHFMLAEFADAIAEAIIETFSR